MDSSERFTGRVAAYDRGRPRYPRALIDRLCRGLAESAVVADIGAGTGLLGEPFVERGHPLHAVEPNAAMREAAARRFAGQPGVLIRNGRAEATGLASASVGLIVVGQAFHWFDRAATRREFLRILRPGGQLALVWNDRLSDSSDFMRGYEALLREHGTDYAQVEHRNLHPAVLAHFFGPEGCRLLAFANPLEYDWEALLARLHSTSYVPGPDEPGYLSLREGLRALFERHQQGGRVRFDYETLAYLGTPS